MSVILQNICRRGNKNLITECFILLLMLINMNAQAETRPDELKIVEKLIAQAKELKLAEQPAWLNLLHYKVDLIGARQSQADDSAFFLSATGQINPFDELAADLTGFFEQAKVAEAAQHAQCRFPARLHWLNSRLSFRHLLPAVDCDDYKQWKSRHAAEKITLLFPSMHLDNPASMFGHTFIRFDEKANSPLLSQTLSYAAMVDPSDSSMAYAWKGITGGYSGRFFVKPYYETLREYSDLEQRDIWEYGLNLTEAEIKQLIRHLWEVRNIKFEYYFLRENCSFRLLALLDVARENINMSLSSHPVYAIPVDTVRDVKRAGLISSQSYRPARHNRINFLAKKYSDKVKESGLKISANELKIDQLPSEFTELQQAEVLLLADEILSLNRNPSELEQDIQLNVLSARSKLAVNKQEIDYSVGSAAPESSHLSARWQVSMGEQEELKFYEIGFRPVFHDLLDSPAGFINGSGISVLDASFRWYEEQKKLQLQNLNLFTLQSLVPVQPWSTTTSKKIALQIKKRGGVKNNEITELNTEFGLGYSAEIFGSLMYFLLDAKLEYATELEDNHAMYLGAEAGSYWYFNNSYFNGQAEIRYQMLYHQSGEKGDIEKFNAGLHVDIIENHALRMEYESIVYDKFDVEEARLSYYLYF